MDVTLIISQNLEEKSMIGRKLFIKFNYEVKRYLCEVVFLGDLCKVVADIFKDSIISP